MAVMVEPVATVFAAEGSCGGLTIRVTEGTTAAPLLLPLPELLLLDEEPLLLEEELLELLLLDELPGRSEILGPPPPQPARTKENRTATQAWAIV